MRNDLMKVNNFGLLGFCYFLKIFNVNIFFFHCLL